MSDSKSFASLTPTLLARKGGAKPAMRPQLQPMQVFHDNVAREMHDDLGWNDMGEGHANHGAEVIALNGRDPLVSRRPDVLAQRDDLAASVGRQPAAPRRPALSQGRQAAFTLRLDAERHLRLRLASTVDGRSAQQIVTEALDRLLDDMPGLDELAANVRKNR